MSGTGTVAVVALTIRVLLIGAFLMILPRITRKGLLFGTYVGEGPAEREAADRIRSSWYRGCLFVMLLSIVVGWAIALAGAPMAGNFAGTAVLLLGALVLYARLYPMARRLSSSRTDEHARIAVAPLGAADPREAVLAWSALALCSAASVGAYVFVWFANDRASDSFPWMVLFASINLLLSPFLAVHALLTAKAKRSIRGGTGGGSLEAQNAFRSTLSRTFSAWALVTCAFMTFVSVEITRVGRAEVRGWTLLVPALFTVIFMVVSLAWIMKAYGQGGALLERGTTEAPLTNGLADNAHWVWGLFYVDRHDPSILVEKRFGIGYTFNYGNRAAILIIVGFVGLALTLVAVSFFALTMS